MRLSLAHLMLIKNSKSLVTVPLSTSKSNLSTVNCWLQIHKCLLKVNNKNPTTTYVDIVPMSSLRIWTNIFFHWDNLLKFSITVIQTPVNWVAMQIDWLVSMWWEHCLQCIKKAGNLQIKNVFKTFYFSVTRFWRVSNLA